MLVSSGAVMELADGSGGAAAVVRMAAKVLPLLFSKSFSRS